MFKKFTIICLLFSATLAQCKLFDEFKNNLQNYQTDKSCLAAKSLFCSYKKLIEAPEPKAVPPSILDAFKKTGKEVVQKGYKDVAKTKIDDILKKEYNQLILTGNPLNGSIYIMQNNMPQTSLQELCDCKTEPKCKNIITKNYIPNTIDTIINVINQIPQDYINGIKMLIKENFKTIFENYKSILDDKPFSQALTNFIEQTQNPLLKTINSLYRALEYSKTNIIQKVTPTSETIEENISQEIENQIKKITEIFAFLIKDKNLIKDISAQEDIKNAAQTSGQALQEGLKNYITKVYDEIINIFSNPDNIKKSYTDLKDKISEYKKWLEFPPIKNMAKNYIFQIIEDIQKIVETKTQEEMVTKIRETSPKILEVIKGIKMFF